MPKATARIVYSNPPRFYIGDVEVTEAEFRHHKLPKRKWTKPAPAYTQRPENWPMASEALGCAEDQIAHFTEDAKKRGIPTQFTPDGRPIFTSPGHRRDYLRAYGYHDKNGGYSE